MLTPELERVIGAEEPEYLEAIAMNAAADDSLRLLSFDESAAPCRVVIAADVPAAELSMPSQHVAADEELLPTARSLRAPLAWDAVDSIHADSEEALADIALARGGDEEAFESVAEEDLMWYDVAERALLARELERW